MAVKGNVPEFKTLKECLEFLEWLRKNNDMKGRVSNRLIRLLKDRYKEAKQGDIEHALSQFLNIVNTFHAKLCKKAEPAKYKRINAVEALEALIQCIPKFLSVMYFLQYQVDRRFSAVGGGKWANLQVGMLDLYARIVRQPDQLMQHATAIEKYFVTRNGSEYGVIPGGFYPGDLKPISQGGYSEGHLMVNDLGTLLDKHSNPNNLFRDVFVTSVVSKNSSVETSNVANAIRLVEDFCGIFRDVKDEQDFKNNLQSRNNCISWLELKDHCIKLKGPLEKIFKNDRFSFTGYARIYKYLNKEKIATKMAKWLKNNLEALRRTLAGIRPEQNVNKFAITYLFPYGFTFNGYNFGTRTNSYKARKSDWDSAIEELKKNNEGLHELKRILDGTICQVRQENDHEPESDDEPVPEDLEYVEAEDDDKPLPAKTEAAKPVVTKVEATKPADTRSQSAEYGHDQDLGKKSEGAQNQGKKAEGAQNQGKKAEGAQNQGKKAEGTTNQPGGQSDGNGSSAGTPSPGDPVTSSGQDLGGQGYASGAGQTRGPDDLSDSATASTKGPSAAGPSQGGGGSEGDEGHSRSSLAQERHKEIEAKFRQQNARRNNKAAETDQWLREAFDAVEKRKAEQQKRLNAQRELQKWKTLQYYDPKESTRPPHSAIHDVPVALDGDSLSNESNDPGISWERAHKDAWKLPAELLKAIEKREKEKFRTNLQEAKRAVFQQQNDNWIAREFHGDDIGEVVSLPPEVEVYRPTTQQHAERNAPSLINLVVDTPDMKDVVDHQMWPQTAIQDDFDIRSSRKSAFPTEITEPIPGAQIGMDPILDPPDVLVSHPPKVNKTNMVAEDLFSAVSRSLSIDVPKRPFQDRLHDVELDDTDANMADVLRNEIKHPDAWYGYDKGFSALPKSNFDLGLTSPLLTPDGNGTGLSHDPSDGVSASGSDQQRSSGSAGSTSTSKASGLGVGEGGRVGEGDENGRHHVKTMAIIPPEKICVQPTLENLWKLSGKDGIQFCDPINKLPPRTQVFNRRPPDEIWSEHIQKEEKKQQMAEDQYKAHGSTLILDGSQPTDDVDAHQEPWWYSDPAYSEINGKTVDDDIQEQLKNEQEAEKLYWETKQKMLGDHIDQRNRLRERQKQDTLEIEEYRIHEENKVNQVLQNIQKEAEENESIAKGLDGQPVVALDGQEEPHYDYAKIKNDVDIHSAHQILQHDYDQRQLKLQTLHEESMKTIAEQKEIEDAAKVEAERIHAFNSSKFGISRAPTPRVKDPEIDFSIQTFHYEDRTINDVDLDDPYANTADILEDELKPAEDKGFSGLPNTNFDLNFAPERIGLEGYEDPGMPRDSPRKADERVINPFSTDECLNPWSVSTSTSSTDTVQPPTSPPPATDHLPPPKTVREMLHWFVGLNTQGYIGLISEHVKSILQDINKDASEFSDALEVTGDPDQLTASMVTAKLTEACLYSATVIYKIRHNNDFKAFSTFDFKKEYSQLHYAADPACLLCQLRDYIYACHHQLMFLKAQCNRGKSHGGWQNCKYGSDTKTPSPLQSFLTDGWDSDFETHPFDPCNLCRKSRVRMGFRKDDLPEISQQGSVISSILTPSCGGSDPLLTLASYLNCLTRRTPRTTGELVSYFHHFGIELHGYVSALSLLGTAITKSYDLMSNLLHIIVDGVIRSTLGISRCELQTKCAHALSCC
ncbi:hypothetical protein BBBOND_0312810 [Babesia bigemina]|uniref:Ribosome-binding protein 1 n=1 Tax=Babesia bigemina TaxID=5866 RepID=A0A061DA27_BABBI|nr:hypothetical protein BBBOND_0312810 [Babesia bigemina]CDR97378.1 hypothetical protein BBBOND_0312810 [Babesia bigemina]|eukprot:XP_012769564.1 hypothetical protein BBBOND_0312810 [Babesia bigemina]